MEDAPIVSDQEVLLKLSLGAMSAAMNEFISACMDDNGKPQVPSYQALMKARGSLPPYCDKALSKKNKPK